jgi:hypothetical protein
MPSSARQTRESRGSSASTMRDGDSPRLSSMASGASAASGKMDLFHFVPYLNPIPLPCYTQYIPLPCYSVHSPALYSVHSSHPIPLPCYTQYTHPTLHIRINPSLLYSSLSTHTLADDGMHESPLISHPVLFILTPRSTCLRCLPPIQASSPFEIRRRRRPVYPLSALPRL